MKKYSLPEKEKVKRFFTFGCSFTEYNFDTWANILGDHFCSSEFYNYGKAGSGNVAIASKIIQANILHNFNKDDLIIICWTFILRESRILNNQNCWKHTGNIWDSNDTYDKKFLKKYVNNTHYAVESMTQLHIIEQLLKKIECNYFYLFLAHPLVSFNEAKKELLIDMDVHRNVIEIFKSDLLRYKKVYSYASFYKTFENTKSYVLPNDLHCSPYGHAIYLQNVFNIKFNSKSFQEKIQKSNISQIGWNEDYSDTNFKSIVFRDTDKLNSLIFQ